MIKFWNYIRTWIIVRRKRVWRIIGLSQNSDFTRFAIICAPRSGSTLLHTYLNSHNNILSHGEIIRRKVEKGEELLSIDEFAFSPHSKSIQAVGLKLFYEYQYQKNYSIPFAEVVKDKRIKIIHLIRKDKKGQLTSLRKAEESGVWSSTFKGEADVDVSITEKEFSKYTHKQEKLEKGFKSTFQYHNVFEITYEDLMAHPRDILAEVQEFLGVTPKKLFTLLEKQRR